MRRSLAGLPFASRAQSRACDRVCVRAYSVFAQWRKTRPRVSERDIVRACSHMLACLVLPRIRK